MSHLYPVSQSWEAVPVTVDQAHLRAKFLQDEATAALQQIYAELADALLGLTPKRQELAKRDAECRAGVVRRELCRELEVVAKALLDTPGRRGRKIQREYPWQTQRQEQDLRRHETVSIGNLADKLHLGTHWVRSARGARKPSRLLSIGA